MSADDRYEQQNDPIEGDIPSGDVKDIDYVSRSGQSTIPVQKDDAPVEGPYDDPAAADSDEMLERDEKDAIDQSNVINDRTRGATKQKGTYAEPGDEEGLPSDNDGTPSVR
ncbi:hypothetical protein M501DRAFT_1013048 [Patellaria atrata CBS 101060]|uniref:Histone chaperone domain-containing protein n=1 Tax=Patellaria atrata CBS 101060 TaxID=1346257 RepID=A0A9P4SKU5_9PEZI|nr:hypothetical protein M501DRAFT_1013048 [Patellaria atrata CBS 101060]